MSTESAPSISVPVRKTSRRSAQHVFWVLFVIIFFNSMDRNILSGTANVIAHELGFGVDSIGYVTSAFVVVFTLCTFPLGIWADRAKRKNVVAISVAVWSVATACTALAFNFVSFFLARMILGVGEAGYLPAGTALLSDYFSREQRARIMSWWNIGQLCGVFFGITMGGIIAGLYFGSWRLAFLIAGIPGLLFAFLAWRLREPRRNEADEAEVALSSATGVEAQDASSPLPSRPGNLLVQIRDLLRIKTLVVLTLLQISTLFVFGVVVPFSTTFLQQKDAYSLSSAEAGLVVGLAAVIAGGIGTLASGYLADLLSRRYAGARVLVGGLALLITGPAFWIAMAVHNFTIYVLCFTIFGIFVSFFLSPGMAATVDVVPSAIRATAMAVTLFLGHLLGDAFSPTLDGILARAFDPTGGTHFANNMAGHDIALAMIVTCVPVLIIGGLVGTFGSLWMKGDVEAAQAADRLAQQANPSLA